MPKKVLIIVDVQKDFCAGGALAVPGAEDIIPVINRLMAQGGYDLVIATKDWHPPDHISFAPEYVGKAHCVQGTDGAELHRGLNRAAINFIQHKGEDPNVDSNSAFRDNAHDRLTGLDAYIREQAGDDAEIHVCGLVTGRCVKLTALDARELLPKAKVIFIEDASQGKVESSIRAKREMAEAGIDIVNSQTILPAQPSAHIRQNVTRSFSGKG